MPKIQRIAREVYGYLAEDQACLFGRWHLVPQIFFELTALISLVTYEMGLYRLS